MCCEACGSARAPWHLITIPEFGTVRACISGGECRQRAQNAGIWKSTLPGGVRRIPART